MGYFRVFSRLKLKPGWENQTNRWKTQLSSKKSYEWRNILMLFHNISKLIESKLWDFSARTTHRAQTRREGHLECRGLGL